MHNLMRCQPGLCVCRLSTCVARVCRIAIMLSFLYASHIICWLRGRESRRPEQVIHLLTMYTHLQVACPPPCSPVPPPVRRRRVTEGVHALHRSSLKTYPTAPHRVRICSNRRALAPHVCNTVHLGRSIQEAKIGKGCCTRYNLYTSKRGRLNPQLRGSDRSHGEGPETQASPARTSRA